MRRKISVLAACLMLISMVTLTAGAEMTMIAGQLTRKSIPFKGSYPDNEVKPGVSTTTGLPYDGPYLPIMLVIDNAPAAHPHWGVVDADVMYQVPNAGGGATKLLALFSDKAPQEAGGIRSARVPFLDIAATWGAVLVHAGSPGKTGNLLSDVPARIAQLGGRSSGLFYDALGNNNYSQRVNWQSSPHDLSIYVEKIRDTLISQGKTFQPRGFKFTDEAPQGIPAVNIELNHRGNKEDALANPASWSAFRYDANEGGYLRNNSSGPYMDLLKPYLNIPFANVIVQRTPITGVAGGYTALEELVGRGAADLFIGGVYIEGGWQRDSHGSRTVYVGPDGEEIGLLRGRTFIIITNDVTEVSYGP